MSKFSHVTPASESKTNDSLLNKVASNEPPELQQIF